MRRVGGREKTYEKAELDAKWDSVTVDSECAPESRDHAFAARKYDLHMVKIGNARE